MLHYSTTLVQFADSEVLFTDADLFLLGGYLEWLEKRASNKFSSSL